MAMHVTMLEPEADRASDNSIMGLVLYHGKFNALSLHAVIRHGQNGYLGDGAIPALHSASPLHRGSDMDFFIPELACNANYQESIQPSWKYVVQVATLVW